MFVVYGLHSILYLGGVCVAHAYDKWIYNCKLVRVLCGRGTTRARSPCRSLSSDSLLARARREHPAYLSRQRARAQLHTVVSTRGARQQIFFAGQQKARITSHARDTRPSSHRRPPDTRAVSVCLPNHTIAHTARRTGNGSLATRRDARATPLLRRASRPRSHLRTLRRAMAAAVQAQAPIDRGRASARGS